MVPELQGPRVPRVLQGPRVSSEHLVYLDQPVSPVQQDSRVLRDLPDNLGPQGLTVHQDSLVPQDLRV